MKMIDKLKIMTIAILIMVLVITIPVFMITMWLTLFVLILMASYKEEIVESLVSTYRNLENIWLVILTVLTVPFVAFALINIKLYNNFDLKASSKFIKKWIELILITMFESLTLYIIEHVPNFANWITRMLSDKVAYYVKATLYVVTIPFALFPLLLIMWVLIAMDETEQPTYQHRN